MRSFHGRVTVKIVFNYKKRNYMAYSVSSVGLVGGRHRKGVELAIIVCIFYKNIEAEILKQNSKAVMKMMNFVHVLRLCENKQ